MGQMPDLGSRTFRIAIRWMVSDAAWQKSPLPDDLESIWTRVQNIFTIFCSNSGSLYTSASAMFLWHPVAASTLKPFEPVVYILDSVQQSLIVPRYGSVDTTATGNTQTGGALNLSEVYLAHPYHDETAFLSNTIIHELMHNKLNKGVAMHDLAPFAGDIGGFMQERLPRNSDLKPTTADITNAGPALSSVIPQQIGI